MECEVASGSRCFLYVLSNSRLQEVEEPRASTVRVALPVIGFNPAAIASTPVSAGIDRCFEKVIVRRNRIKYVIVITLDVIPKLQNVAFKFQRFTEQLLLYIH